MARSVGAAAAGRGRTGAGAGRQVAAAAAGRRHTTATNSPRPGWRHHRVCARRTVWTIRELTAGGDALIRGSAPDRAALLPTSVACRPPQPCPGPGATGGGVGPGLRSYGDSPTGRRVVDSGQEHREIAEIENQGKKQKFGRMSKPVQDYLTSNPSSATITNKKFGN